MCDNLHGTHEAGKWFHSKFRDSQCTWPKEDPRITEIRSKNFSLINASTDQIALVSLYEGECLPLICSLVPPPIDHSLPILPPKSKKIALLCSCLSYPPNCFSPVSIGR